jgi:hypothetical protein
VFGHNRSNQIHNPSNGDHSSASLNLDNACPEGSKEPAKTPLLWLALEAEVGLSDDFILKQCFSGPLGYDFA